MPRPEENYHSTDRITNSYPSTEAGQVHVANRGCHEPGAVLLDRTQADLDRKLAAVLVPGQQIEAGAHWPQQGSAA